MSTLVGQSQSTAKVVYQGYAGSQNGRLPYLPHTDGLLVKIARSIETFYDTLNGPPMTKRERVRNEIATGKSRWICDTTLFMH